jgi:2-keto-3-deoxy-L-rhamnonate aldolase RhmA
VFTVYQISGVTDITPQGETIFSVANKHVAIIPQVESRVGIQNLESILNMDEISAFMIGGGFQKCCLQPVLKIESAGDLRLDMGLPLGMTGDEPEFVAAVEKATKVSKERNIPLLGLAIGPEMVKLRLDQGFTILACCSDFYTMAFGMMAAVAEARATAETHMKTIQK